MEDEQVLWPSTDSNSNSNSMVSATLGRVMSTLLSARPKKLQDAISRLHSPPKRGSFVTLEESLWILHTYVREAAQREESLDEILVPITQHSLKHKESKHGNQAMILFNWLFQDEIIFQALATNLVGIIRRKEDRYIALGWCILVRGLVEYEITMKQFINNGIKDKYRSLRKIFSSCISHLISIVCIGSTLQGGFELPTRLSVAAADCILALTEALTKKDLVSDGSDDRLKPSNPNLSFLPITLAPAAFVEKKVKPTSRSPDVLNNMEMKLLLWDHLDELIILVQRLDAWSRKSRSLHAYGLERVLKWLQGTKGHYAHLQTEAGSQMHKTGVLLLSSCWKHYGMLMHLEDYKFYRHYKELVDQYLSGIQFYADNYTEEHAENKESGVETIKFFLNCLSLLLGHLDGKQFEDAMSEDGLRISRVLISQLHCADVDVIDGAVCILKAVIFRSNSSLAGSSLTNTREMDALLPLLLHLLDERDGTARAVVVLIAEYCSISTDNQCLKEVLQRLASGAVLQRRNAIDVISELFHISPDSVYCRQDIANHLLKLLGDEELVIRAQATKLIPMMDPSLLLPALVRLVCSSDEILHSSASNTFVAVLKYHNKKFEVLCMLLDCLSNICQNPDLPQALGDRGKEGSKLDADSVLNLIPQWSESVEDWNSLIEPLIDKMFAEPSNAIIVRFLSYISEHLADAVDVVFHQLLLHTRQQNRWENRNYEVDNPLKLEHSLFDCLCPLLIIRLLPLRVFNDLNSSLIYGELCKQDTGYFDINDAESVAGILLNRAFNKFEFEDVRKLSAELCGRIHPQVLFPLIASQLEHAVDARDVLKIKACLFSICTSLVARGRDSLLHPIVLKIRNTIETILLWPSSDGDEVSKAQHGCIDCLALMICTELQALESFRDLTSKNTSLVRMDSSRDAAMRDSVRSYVLHQLTRDKDCTYEASISMSFVLCMANVLISACQKIPDSCKRPFAREILPRLIQSVEVMMESEYRAACLQVFFSAVYHLKSTILPYTSDLLRVSLKSLREGSEKEKMAGAKLMASLMASEEAIVNSIAGGLLEAITVLSSLSSSDPSPDVRQVSEKLLACLTSL
ncbi:hypothetical protein LOK49_LG12G02906 [Camellia lanceoleosa]|uniref:Uncharacterized protein n=1 Tax=Camellia lanceoleosa TaxID=1840588 RepID=A0ACC0FSB1_9ERIC|nr:hypothetical protein LOK49_LG12G02906 [Camellia lanceoleosa]